MDKLKMGTFATAEVVKSEKNSERPRFGGVFTIECRAPDGTLKWREECHNLVVNEGLNLILDTLFDEDYGDSSGIGAPWYVGLLAASPSPSATDGLSDLSRFTDYDEAARQAFVDVRSNQSVSNAASKAVFTISQDSSSIGGAFLASDSTKDGTTGTLLCEVAFSGGNKAADDDDTLNVQYTFTAADDGA